MARGKNVPSGVMYFDSTGDGRSTKGSRHPDAIGSGREMTDKISGSKPERPGASGGGTSRRPSAVKAASGTENLKTSPSTKAATPASARPSGSASRTPSGVREHGGKSAPKSIK